MARSRHDEDDHAQGSRRARKARCTASGSTANASRAISSATPPGAGSTSMSRRAMTAADLPLLVDLVGYTAGGPAHTNWKNYGENVPERLDRLIGTGAMPPVVVAFPDCFTRLGGNQYVDSAAMGPWETFLIREMLPFVEERFGCGGDGRRGVFGKSSGGYGAMVHALRHGGSVWSAAASHSGDVGFEFLYHLGEFAGALRHLVDHDMSIETFLRKFEAGPKAKDKDWHTHDDARPGGELRSRSEPVLRHPPAGGSRRPARSSRSAGPTGCAGTRCAWSTTARAPGQPAQAEGLLHRLRRYRPVQHGLRLADHAPEARRPPAFPTPTRNSTTTIPRSITAWTSACRCWRRR